MCTWLCCRSHSRKITEEDIDKALAARAERAKKTLEEIKEKSDIPAMRRNEGIRKAADWVIEHSTIEEK